MGSGSNQLHIFFFPFMAHGHMIPSVDMAKLFAFRGLKTTIVTTPLNVPAISRTIKKTQNMGFDISIQTVKFPAAEAGLPEGLENMDSISSKTDYNRELTGKFMKATYMLQQYLEDLLQEHKPDCLVADMFFPWSTYAASKFGIPRLVFHGTSIFSMCGSYCVTKYEPHKFVSSDSELFVVPNLPGDITMTAKQLPDYVREKQENMFSEMIKQVSESDSKSYGVVINSFYELESAYADYYKNVMGRKAWCIGPVSLCNKDLEDKAQRGKDSALNESECLKWLDSKRPNSVIYLCFGSVANFTEAQLKEIAKGLEASGLQFIWVVSSHRNGGENEWVPEGFEARMEGTGLVIRGWAPQILILEHEAVGGFVTHCGWNSTLEGITAGKPMMTWPVSADQFYNEKLVTQVLKIGVSVGVKQFVRLYGDKVSSEGVEKAVRRLMEGEEVEEMRGRAKSLSELARKAVEGGGSSYSNLNSLIEELGERKLNLIKETGSRT